MKPSDIRKLLDEVDEFELMEAEVGIIQYEGKTIGKKIDLYLISEEYADIHAHWPKEEDSQA